MNGELNQRATKGGPAEKQPSATRFRGDIQGIRALAVAAVVAAHIALYQASGHSGIAGGFIGVDVFFVLSGYLITSLLVREVAEKGRVSITSFYARRARRILPAATLVLVAVVTYAAWRLPDAERTQFSRDAGWSVVFLANWHFASAGVNYFDTTVLSPLQHFWSLAVEEQFYLVWPLLIGLLAPRVRKTWLGLLVVAICGASLAWSVFVTSYSGPVSTHEAYFSSFARAYELGIGALVAILAPRIRSTFGRTVIGLVGLAVIIGCIVLVPADAAYPGWQALIPCLATAMLLVAGTGTAQIATTRLLSSPPLRFLGNISYSLYLWHFPIIVFAPTLFPKDWRLPVLITVEVLVMIAVSTASYYVVEQPFHRGRVRLLRRRNSALVMWPLALALVFGFIWGGDAYASHEDSVRRAAEAKWYQAHHLTASSATPKNAAPTTVIRDQLQAAVKQAIAGAPFPPNLDMGQILVPEPGVGYECFASDGYTRPPHPCVYGDQSSKWVVALIGDSHAGMLVPFLGQMGKRDHFKVVMYQKLGCAPYYVEQRSGTLASQCDNFRAWTYQMLRTEKPNVVIMYGRGFLFVNPGPGQTIAGLWRGGEIQAVQRYKALGARVLMIGDVPDRGQQPANCIDGNTHEYACMVTPTTPESQSNVVTQAVAQLEKVDYLNMQQFVCVGGQCPLVVGSTILYWDDSHLARGWINHISAALAQKFGPLILPPTAFGSASP